MAEVGDRVELQSKSGVRTGAVVAASGSVLRVRWDSGEETSIVPGPGVLRVMPRAPSRRKVGASAKDSAGGAKASKKKATTPTKAPYKTATKPKASKKTLRKPPKN